MFDPMKKYQTRCGFPYMHYYVHYDEGQRRAVIHGAIQYPEGYRGVVSHNIDLTTINDDARYDLVEVGKCDIDMSCYTDRIIIDTPL